MIKAKILDKLIPDNIDFNYYTVLSRASSLMIRQNSILMAQLMNPDILIDIQMNHWLKEWRRPNVRSSTVITPAIAVA